MNSSGRVPLFYGALNHQKVLWKNTWMMEDDLNDDLEDDLNDALEDDLNVYLDTDPHLAPNPKL